MPKLEQFCNITTTVELPSGRKAVIKQIVNRDWGKALAAYGALLEALAATHPEPLSDQVITERMPGVLIDFLTVADTPEDELLLAVCRDPEKEYPDEELPEAEREKRRAALDTRVAAHIKRTTEIVATLLSCVGEVTADEMLEWNAADTAAWWGAVHELNKDPFARRRSNLEASGRLRFLRERARMGIEGIESILASSSAPASPSENSETSPSP